MDDPYLQCIACCYVLSMAHSMLLIIICDNLGLFVCSFVCFLIYLQRGLLEENFLDKLQISMNLLGFGLLEWQNFC